MLVSKVMTANNECRATTEIAVVMIFRHSIHGLLEIH